MSNLSEKTLTTYRSTMNSLYKKIGLGNKMPIDDGDWIKSNFAKIVEYIDAMKSDFSKKNNYAILKVWCDTFDIDDKKTILVIEKKIDELNESVNNTYATNTMNDKIADNWVSIEQMREKVVYLKQKLPNIEAIDTYKEYMALMKYLCLMIHIEVPLRNDLADAKLVSELPKEVDNNVNYLVMKKSGVKLYLNNYKTSKDYGSKIIDLPKEVGREIIKYSAVILKMSPHGWFICKDGLDEPVSRPTYTKMLNSIFNKDGVKVSSTQIRRAVVSDLYKVDEDEYKKKAELANVMGHSVNTAGLVYAKVLPKKN